MDWHFEEGNALTKGFQHLHIPVDDVEDENLIRYFPQSAAFVHDALNGKSANDKATISKSAFPSDPDELDPGNGVLIHW
jgi:hypothetical protein